MQITEEDYLSALDIVEKSLIKKVDKAKLNKLLNETLFRLLEYSYES